MNPTEEAAIRAISSQMTDTERLMRDFESKGPSCKKHGERPKVGFDGVWFVECSKGCSVHDGENHTVTPVLMEWVKVMQ